MHDLIVVPTPIPEPPYGVVVVRAPGSIREPAMGFVRIEHLSTTGHDDVIDRPVIDAVPLFWRFMIEKFGVDPGAREPGKSWRTAPSRTVYSRNAARWLSPLPSGGADEVPERPRRLPGRGVRPDRRP